MKDTHPVQRCGFPLNNLCPLSSQMAANVGDHGTSAKFGLRHACLLKGVAGQGWTEVGEDLRRHYYESSLCLLPGKGHWVTRKVCLQGCTGAGRK